MDYLLNEKFERRSTQNNKKNKKEEKVYKNIKKELQNLETNNYENKNYEKDILLKIQQDQKFLEEYNTKLLKVKRDINRKKGKSLTQSSKEAINDFNENENILIIPPNYLDPLVFAYEEKIEILEDEVL